MTSFPITSRVLGVLSVLAVVLAGCSTSRPIDAAPMPTSVGRETPDAERTRDVASAGDEAVRPAALPTSVPTLREPWTFAAYPGIRITTPNYRIYTTIGNERILERLPLFLECAMIRYTSSLANLPPPRRPVETFVFRDRRQWSAKTRQILPDQAGAFDNLGRGGFATRGVSVLYYIDWAGQDRDTFAIAAHEGWHQYTQSTFRNPLPIWLEEGIATYMEGYRWRNSAVPDFNPARNWERRRELRDAMRANRLIPLNELLVETPQSFLKKGKNRLLTYYAQVWALTRFLVEHEDGRYRGRLARVLEDAAAGRLLDRLMRSPAVLANGGRGRVARQRVGPWVILAYMNSDLGAFERDFLEFMRSIAR